jgi:hypothetical protein
MTADGHSSAGPRLGEWLAVSAATFALYAATASRGVQWQDSSHFMYRIAHGDVTGELGLALSHPLHHWLGRIMVAIFGPHPLAMTLLSALGGALAVGNVFGCVTAVTRSRAAALFAAASLALASTFWRVSTITEVYTVSAALLAGTCWCLALYAQQGSKRALWLACLLNGLGGANDLQSGLTTPVLLAVVVYEAWRRRLTVVDGLIASAAWLAGVMPYGALVIAELLRSGDLAATVRSALFGTMWSDQVMGGGLSLRVLFVDVGYPLLNFPNLLLPAAVYGLMRARQLGMPALLRGALIAILAVQAAFALRYDIVEQYNFFLPMYVLLVIFGGVGAAAVLRRQPEVRWLQIAAVALLALTPVTYAAATAVARHYHVLARFERNKPYRDDYVYLIIPWSVVERSADRMSRQVLRLAGPNGRIVFEDWMARYAVLYTAMMQGRSEPEMVWWDEPATEGFIRSAVADGRPVVLIPWDRNAPQSQPPLGRWKRDGDVYVLGP